tara:strand:+ start:571 stop:786 length:216 start_codon:yes stop_codon:yes gene_type:complete
MSNQRPGKVIRAADPTMKDMTTLKFFKNAQKVLEQSDKEDEAFYFEQMVDWLSSGRPLPTTEEQTIKALGI